MRRNLLFAGLGIALITSILWISNLTFVIAGNEYSSQIELFDGELMLVDTGHYTVAIVVDPFDIDELPNGIDKKPCFVKKLIPVSPEMTRALTFYERGGDMATVSSKIYLKNSKVLTFKGGLVLSDSLIGIQHERFGWLEAKYPSDFINFIKSLKSCSSPLLIL